MILVKVIKNLTYFSQLDWFVGRFCFFFFSLYLAFFISWIFLLIKTLLFRIFPDSQRWNVIKWKPNEAIRTIQCIKEHRICVRITVISKTENPQPHRTAVLEIDRDPFNCFLLWLLLFKTLRGIERGIVEVPFRAGHKFPQINRIEKKKQTETNSVISEFESCGRLRRNDVGPRLRWIFDRISITSASRTN